MKIELPTVTAQGKIIKDPLGVMQSESSATRQRLKSESMVNDKTGVCPKCGQDMTTATIDDGEKVFYCVKCRVASPKPND